MSHPETPNPQELQAVSSDFARWYMADDLQFELFRGSTLDPRDRYTFAEFFNLASKHPRFASQLNDLYGAIDKAKGVRGKVDERLISLAVRSMFVGWLDDDPFTPRLIGDIVLSRLENPVTSSSDSIMIELVALRCEMKPVRLFQRYSVESILSHVFSGKLRIVSVPTPDVSQ